MLAAGGAFPQCAQAPLGHRLDLLFVAQARQRLIEPDRPGPILGRTGAQHVGEIEHGRRIVLPRRALVERTRPRRFARHAAAVAIERGEQMQRVDLIARGGAFEEGIAAAGSRGPAGLSRSQRA